MATFITAKSVGENLGLQVYSSTGYWKYNHDGVDSPVKTAGYSSIPVTNANGEFTIISCDSNGNQSGYLQTLYLDNNQITSFDGTGLSNLQYLYLQINQLTSFDGTGLTSLTNLELATNQLTSFDGTDLSNLSNVGLGDNQLTSLTNFVFPTSLNSLGLSENQLTSLNNFVFPTSLSFLNLGNNQFTSFSGTGLSNLQYLFLYGNQLTSFDGTGLSNLQYLYLQNNQISSFTWPAPNGGESNGGLMQLVLVGNQLTSLDITNMPSLTFLALSDPYGLNGNPMTTSANDSLLTTFYNRYENYAMGRPYVTIHSQNGRTAATTSMYDSMIGWGWNLIGLDLVTPPVTGNGKLRIKGVNSGGGTTTTTTTTTEAPTTTTTTTEAPTTTTTTTAAPSYMFSIPQPDPNVPQLQPRFGSNNIITTSGYWKFVRTNNNGVYTSSVFGNGPVGTMIPLGYGNFTIISCDVNGNPSGTITQMTLNGLKIDTFNGTHSGLSGLTRLAMVTNSITSLDVSSMTNLNTLLIAGPYGGNTEDAMTPQSNTDILLQLNANGLQNGTFTTNGGRVTSQASEAAYLGLINKGWTLLGLSAV